MQKTKISYITHTWNPIKMRCTPVSFGCDNCWHLAMAKRLAKNPSCYADQQRGYAGGSPMLDQKELGAPLHLKKSARIGVQFMGDLFHESVPLEWIGKILCLARGTEQHKFFFLTKRPKRMREALWAWDMKGDVIEPKPNHLYFGVSIEDQKTADERIPILLQIPAAHRWVSVEPMLGKIKLLYKWLSDSRPYPKSLELGSPMVTLDGGIDWIVVGGETSSKARPLHPDWVRSVVQQCKSAGVPLFIKQLNKSDGKDINKWPEDFRVREFPNVA